MSCLWQTQCNFTNACDLTEIIRSMYSQLHNTMLPANVLLPSGPLLGERGSNCVVNHLLWGLAEVVMLMGFLFLRGSLQKCHLLYVYVDMLFVGGRCEVALNWKLCSLRKC